MSKGPTFTRFVLDNSWVVGFPTPSGVLRLLPGEVAVEAAFEEEKFTEDWLNRVDCTLRVADADGRVWEATSRFLTGDLFWGIVDLSRPDSGRWLRNAPPEWRQAFAQRGLLADASFAADDRLCRHAWVDNTGFCWRFKWFSAVFALAALDEATLLVSLDGMLCSWSPLPVMGPDGPLPMPPRRVPLSDDERNRLEDEGELGGHDLAEALVYPVEAGRILFRNLAAQDERGYWQDSPVPRPLVFHATHVDAPPQRCVAFQAERPRAAPPGCDEGFVPMGDEYDGEQFEFVTDAGGHLRVTGGLGRYLVRVEKYPDGLREPFDVLRCRVRVTDADGRVWECLTHCTPEVFFERMVNLRAGEEPLLDGSAAASEGALTGIRTLLDDGAWRCALMGDHLVAFLGRGQHPLVDIKPLPRGFAVRMTGLIGRRRAVGRGRDFSDLDPDDRPFEPPAWDEDLLLPAVNFLVPMAALVFRNTTFAVDDGFWHRNAIPIPVVFTRVGTATPDPHVRFVEGFADTGG